MILLLSRQNSNRLRRLKQKLNAEEELNPKHPRRPASDEDFDRLLTATMAGGSFRGLTGPDRAMLYLTAVSTGFRAAELAGLSVDSFDVTSDVPSVTVPAAYSKRRRKDRLPLRGDLATLLREYLDDVLTARNSDVIAIADKRIVWAGTWPEKAADMLKADLAAAGIPYQDERGRFLDFHALRHTFGTNLAKAGVSPKLAQELMRHSDVNLTMGIYSHVDLPDMAAAVERLPSLPGTASQSHQATGTDSVVAGMVAVKTGDIGGSQEISTVTSDQSLELTDESGVRHKPKRGQEVTAFESVHKKEPPMRLELMTYALRKRRTDDVSVQGGDSYDQPNISVRGCDVGFKGRFESTSSPDSLLPFDCCGVSCWGWFLQQSIRGLTR